MNDCYLTKGDAAKFDLMIRFLSKRFNVKRPRLKVSNRRTANHGFQIFNEVHVSKHAQLWVLAHEFAHYLDAVKYRRKPIPTVNGFRNNTDKEWHNECFYWSLRHVINALGDPLDYPWHLEYKQLQRWARKDGLLQ